MKTVAMYLVLVGASVVVTAPVNAGNHCCGQRCDICGCCAECESTCKLVCGHKNESKITYCAQCEEICLPGPSRKCGTECNCTVNPCTGCMDHDRRTVWDPNPCGKIRCKAKLVKIETPRQVPTYKWTVIHYCSKCAGCGCLSQKGPIDESQLATTKIDAEAPALTPAVEKSAVVQASATESVSAPSSETKEESSLDKLETASPVMAVKSKLMSLLGK